MNINRLYDVEESLLVDPNDRTGHRCKESVNIENRVIEKPSVYTWCTVQCAAYTLHCRNIHDQANKSILNLYVGARSGRKGARRRKISTRNKSLHESKRTKNGKPESYLDKIKCLKNSFK